METVEQGKVEASEYYSGEMIGKGISNTSNSKIEANGMQNEIHFDKNHTTAVNDDEQMEGERKVRVDVSHQGSKKCPKFACYQDFFHVKISLPDSRSSSEAIQMLREGFKEMLQTTLWGKSMQERAHFHEMDSQNRVRARVTIEHPSLDIPVQMPFYLARELNEEMVLQEIQRIATSKKEFFLDGAFQLTVFRAVLPVGGRNKSDKCTPNMKSSVRRLKRFIEIRNKDELCFGRALVVAKARVDRDRNYNAVRANNTKTQATYAKALYEKANVKEGPCGPEEWQKFQNHLSTYQIIVVSAEHGNAIIFQGPSREKKLILFMSNNHYDVITSMPAFVNKSYFCWICQRGYNVERDHHCPSTFCHRCETRDCKDGEEREENQVLCSTCHMQFPNQRCYTLHINRGICQSRFQCKVCHKVVDKRKRKKSDVHKCGEIFCSLCKQHVDPTHKCYVKPINPKKRKRNEERPSRILRRRISSQLRCPHHSDSACGCNVESAMNEDENVRETTDQFRYIFFDGESNIEGEHKMNAIVVHKVCNECCHLPFPRLKQSSYKDFTAVNEGDSDEEDGTFGVEFCNICGPRRVVFHNNGDSVVDAFCQYLFQPENSGYTAFSHFGSGYDIQFILQYLYKSSIIPNAIFNGSKCLYLEVQNPQLRILDSFAFLPSPLSSLPKSFDLESGPKGLFAHHFNLAENWNYVGPYPSKDFYDPEGMKRKGKEEFEVWYDEKIRAGDEFDFRKELFEYCDVRILREAVIKFRKLMLDTTSVDPFETTFTIAGACMKVFKSNFLNEEEIGVVPPGGYRSEEKQSYVAIQWLKYLEKEEGIRISHAGNGQEVAIGRAGKVDGYREELVTNEKGEEEIKKIVYEMNGCFFHGCDIHYKSSVLNPVSGKYMGELLAETKRKVALLRSMGYVVIEKWECQWKQEIESNPHIQQVLTSLDSDNALPSPPLNPREAFYGGRTNATKLYHEVEGEEEIKYYDICSLYPYINKYFEYPLKHPEVFTSNFSSNPTEEYFGLIKCVVTPPRGLFHPVLPYRSQGRLMFPLCRTCCEEGLSDAWCCCHEEEERALEGTWCTPELKKAEELGYRITKIYEVWHYPERGIVFAEYVNTFLKLKVEASGWPSECTSEEAKEEYLRQFEEREDVRLDANNIVNNAGLRSLAKLMLNSFWGKWGQRTNLTSHCYVTDPNEYFGIWADQTKEITDINFVNDEMLRIGFKKNPELELPHPNVNVVLAAFTTCNARLRLYSFLERLQRRVLYFDTDSIIFTAKPGEWCPEIGNFLGDLTDECPDLGGHHIVKFASGGPKNYAIEMDTGKKHMKAKGISLNVRNEAVINMDALSEMLFSPCPTEETRYVTIPSFIKRDTRTAKIYSVAMEKKWGIVYTKRAVDWNTFETVPFGY